MKVYVLTAHAEYTDYPAESFVIDVFFNEEDAKAEMEKRFELLLDCWRTEMGYEESDMEITRYPRINKVFNTANNIDYSCFEIFEKEVI